MRTVANSNEIQALIEKGAIFYIGHSGGKDSMAMYEAVLKLVPADQIRVVHADLGEFEHVGVKDFIRSTIYLENHQPIIAKAFLLDGSPADFFGLVRRQRKTLDTPTAKYPNARRETPAWPSSENRFCTSDLKTGPIWREIRRDGDHKIVVNCVGIRGQESKSRALKIAQRGTLNINKKNTTKTGTRVAYDWWPIADWSIDEVWAEIAAAGKEPHPAYANGNDRLSCAFCIFGSVNDLRNAAADRPELLAAFAELEIEVRSTMYTNGTLAERIA